jgi:hypothetical protein
MKALTNLSAAEFLRKVRMEHAAQLLKTNSSPERSGPRIATFVPFF